MKGLLDQFYHWEEQLSDKPFLIQPAEDGYQFYSWKEVGARAKEMAASLQHAGLVKGDRVGILSQNCAEWVIADLAIMIGGYISVPFYANVNSSTLNEILLHSECKLLFVGKLIESDWLQLTEYVPDACTAVSLKGYEKKGLMSYSKYIQPSLPFIKVDIKPDDILTIIYTSGTTGKSKGVVHTHQSITNAIVAAFDTVLLHHSGNRFFSYLPLSHAAERGLVEFGAICSGGSITFVQSIKTFAADLKYAMPTHFFGVPRIWEKIQSGLLEKLSQQKLDLLLSIPILNIYLKRKIKKSLGLHKTKILISGAAPVSSNLMQWFLKLDFKIQEAYGMTENFNVCTINPIEDARIGFVGKLFPGQQVEIDPDTGEIMQQCDWLMNGYYKDPEQNSQTIKNKFLHTGDTGELSKDGYLKITGRIKDIFKTSKGEYIIPGQTEQNFIALKEVDQACVVGVNYPQPFILVVLSALGIATDEKLLHKKLSHQLEECNKGVQDYQKLRKVIIMREEWTCENKLLTPTFKIRRNLISQKYEPLLSGLYSEENIISRAAY